MTDHEPSAAVPTLEDVASKAGVSTATVSRCLNDQSKVSQATQKRVLEAVKALGYAPNFGARALAAKRTNTFGAIIPTMENAIFARGLQAFQDELRDNGVTLLVASSAYRPDIEEDQIRALVARGADALLLIGHDRTEDSYDFLKRRQIPYVIAWVYDSGTSRISIGFDNAQAMADIAKEVIDLGHRHLGYITADRNGNDRARARYEGLCKVLRDHDIDPQSMPIEETSYSIQNGGDAFEQLMKCQPRPTAVLCGNDVLAVGAINRAKTLGLRVPEDVSIVGFDDIEIAEIVSPSLTTVHVPHREMGRKAAKMLLQMRRDPQMAQSLELKTVIKWRESLGPRPQNS